MACTGMTTWQIWFTDGDTPNAFYLVKAINIEEAKSLSVDMAERGKLTIIGITPYLSV
ncbi:hypothetical protein LCGC14_0560960 [marine sediment metagenome]|uniref:Uncharacterized protein n=1 Tax=marine sediment metagenome TaxID=412755 RepID=A0A0F9RLW9_9ZZZZ